MKAPYGFVEVAVQCLVTKLFKDGEIAFYVNSESVSLLSKSMNEIVRFITRKEFNERLMTEKKVRGSEKHKKAVREVMEKLFGIAPSSDEDDAVVGSFLNYTSRLKMTLKSWKSIIKSAVVSAQSLVQSGR